MQRLFTLRLKCSSSAVWKQFRDGLITTGKMKDEFSSARCRKARAIYQSLTRSSTGFNNGFQLATYSAFMDQFSGGNAPARPDSASVGQALLHLLRDPWRNVVLRWNGKAALLSAVFRGCIFLIASIKSHHAGRLGGVLAEALFGAVVAGCFGTLTQALRFAHPKWLANLLLAGVFPLLFQLGDFYFHATLGTQVFRIGMIASASFTVFSSAFNLYIMRRGTLLIGDEGKAFSQDLSALPRLALFFVIAGVMKGWRLFAGTFREVPQKTVTSQVVSPETIASS
jgi:hypothetical protein